MKRRRPSSGLWARLRALLGAAAGAIAMALLTLELEEQRAVCCGCAGCRARATRRLALTIGHCTAALVPLCTGHAEDVRHQHWAMQVEDDWGGSLLDGRQVPTETAGDGVPTGA